MNQTLIAPSSTNAKLGAGVATTYRPVGDSSKGEGTCSSKCPLLISGACYATKSFTNWNQAKARERSDSLDRLLEKGAQFVRLHTSGDFFVNDELDTEYFEEVVAWCKKHPKITVWTYCHNVIKIVEAGYAYSFGNMPKNLFIVASVDTLTERGLCSFYGFKTARVIDTPTEVEQNEVLCPYDKALYNNKGVKKAIPIKCVSCKMCFNPRQKRDIAFLKH